jgi:hypothetical protein
MKLTVIWVVDWNWSGSSVRQQGGADGLPQHRRLEPAEDVARRVGEILGSLERDLNGAGVPVGVDELQTERGRRRRQRRSPLNDIPERTGSFAHDSSFPLSRLASTSCEDSAEQPTSTSGHQSRR